MRVFLSYRREDSAAHAGRLADALRARLGPDGVFLDVAAIRPGTDFTTAIDDALERTDAVLVVVGPRWLSAAADDGRPRLTDPDDYVRREIARALAEDVPVVPVLVGGASLPAAEDLPDELAALARRQAFTLDDTTWHHDLDGLLDSLAGRSPDVLPRSRRRRAVTAAVAAAVLVAGAVTAFVLLRPDDDGGPGGDGLAACPAADGDSVTLFGPDGSAVGRIDGADGPLEFTITAATARPAGGGTWQVVLDTVLDAEGPEGIYHGDYQYETLEVARFPFTDHTCFAADPYFVGPGQRGRAAVGFEVDVDPAQGLTVVVRNGETWARIPLTS